MGGLREIWLQVQKPGPLVPPPMQAALRFAAGEIARGISTGVVVYSGSRCPDCQCSPHFSCPDCICSLGDRGVACSGYSAITVVFFSFALLTVGAFFGWGLAHVVKFPVAKAPLGKARGRGVWLTDGDSGVNTRSLGAGDGSSSAISHHRTH